MAPDSLPSGVCPRCGALGTVPQPCLTGSCAQQEIRLIPQGYASRDGASDPLVGRFIDGYLVVGVLGAGGMGAVHLAIDPAIGLKVALKTLFVAEAWKDHEEKLRTRFLDEARALARIHHPNIVRIHRYGQVDGTPYMAMELVHGGRTLADDMDKRIAAGYWFQRPEVMRIMGELLAGLSAVHAAGVVHRDIKPENMMLQPVEGLPDMVRLVDFGVAALFGTGKPDNELAGTPEYMAPEQLLGAPVGPWTDLYACGVVAYEMLTDKRPFPFDHRDTLLMAKMDPNYQPTSPLVGGGYPPELLAFLAKALSYDRRQRYATAQEFRAGLKEAIDAFNVSATLFRQMGAGSAASNAAFQNWLAGERQRLEDKRQSLEPKVRKPTGKHIAVVREEQATPMLKPSDIPKK